MLESLCICHFSLHVEKHHKVAVYGVGGLGHLAVQYAKAMGKEVHAFTGTKNKEELCKKMGADKVILWDDFYKSDIKHEYDIIINTIPVWVEKEKVNKWLKSLRPYGKFILVGVAPASQEMNLDTRMLVGNHLSVIASCVGGRKHTQEMLEFSAEHNIECICEHYGWEEFPKALDKLENGRPFFRGVVTVDDVSKEMEDRSSK